MIQLMRQLRRLLCVVSVAALGLVSTPSAQQKFHYPGDDYRDLMAGVDEVSKRPYIDTNRLGVTGGSGGGWLTNWTVTQTTRFKAAVAQRDIADGAGFGYTADFTQFTPS
jgi:dipeptidyl aminopeptidase/acylaminoacyl peptidase